MNDDILMDPQTGDLALTAGGELRLTRGLQRVAQRLRLRLLRHRGEWFADQRLGVPHMELALRVKPPRLSEYGAELKRVIRGTRGVDDLTRFDIRQGAQTIICTFGVVCDGQYVTGKFSPDRADIDAVLTDASGVTL